KRKRAAAKNEILVGLVVAAAVVTGIIVLVRFDITGEKGSGLDEEFVYKIEDLIKIDPALILYAESSGPINTGFSQSSSIATDSNGTIYTAGDKAIRVFDINGNLQEEIQIENNPRCLTADEDAKLYIGMSNYIQVYDGQTKQITNWQPVDDDSVLTSIAVWKEDVFVADAGNRIVYRYDTKGNLIGRIGAKDTDRNVPGFVIPSPHFDLAVAKDGLLRIVNPGRHRIEAYTFGGDLEFWWGTYSPNVEGFCGCCNPVNFVILEDESFVTVEKGLVRVKLYDADGNFTGVVAGPEQLLKAGEAKICEFPADCQKGAFDLAVDNQQRILVLDTIRNVIRIYSKTGQNSG
ncbi:MAG: NHL repeat-containing protein, partial [Planctomycetota bacterium]